MNDVGTKKENEIIEYGLELTDKRHPMIVQERSYMAEEKSFTNPKTIVSFCNDALKLDRKAEEHLYMIALSSCGNVLGLFELSHGTMTRTFCGTKEIGSRLLLSGAVNAILVHNHPSGSIAPSLEDEGIADRIGEVMSILDVKMLDFIIIGEEAYYSFAEHDMIHN